MKNNIEGRKERVPITPSSPGMMRDTTYLEKGERIKLRP
jgi:hypothetical protein